MLKKKLSWYVALGVFTTVAAVTIARAAIIIYNAALVNETALAYDNTYTIDLQNLGLGSISAQAVYSSATIASQTFQDGQQSTGSFTIVTNTALSSATAANSITVVDNSTALARATILLPGVVLTNGIDWTTRDVASNTAESLRLALLTVPGFSASRTAGSAIVYATAPAYGSYYNTWPLTSSTPTALAVATPNFTGGRDPAVIALNGVTLKQAQAWNVGAAAANTATNIAAAINADPTLNKIVHAAASGAVVTATSTLANANAFGLRSSTPSALSVNSPAMTNGVAPSYSLNGQITIANHGLTKALAVLYSTGSTLVIGGLTNQTTYYVVPIDANTIGLSSTSAVAQTGVYLTFTSSSTQLTADVGTLAPLPITGTPGFSWQVSNDGINYNPVAVSSVTMSSYSNPPANTLWSFGYIGTRYLRLNVKAPTTGGILLNMRVLGTN